MCELYEQATTLHAQGVHRISCDEKTGIQALERRYADIAMNPGQPHRVE